jgi:hypothetical protein
MRTHLGKNCLCVYNYYLYVYIIVVFHWLFSYNNYYTTTITFQDWKHITGSLFRQENVHFGGSFSLISSSVLINIWMDFDTKSFNTILVIFQIKVIFPQNVFFNTFMFVWMKNLSKGFWENHMNQTFQL